MSGAAAARVGDPIAHSHAGLGMMLGLAAGVVAGVVLVGATVATGGAALAVVAAVGGAAGLASFGGLKGMNIGEASMGPPCGQFVTGAPSVLINGRPATFTAGAFATCSKESGGPIPLATGAATVTITAGLAGRVGETLGCSAKSVSAASPDVVIGGPSAADPAVTINPEVPGWAVTGLQALGVAGALLTLPYSVVALGVAGTLGVGALGMVGSAVGGKAMRAAGEAMGMSEAGVRAMEATGELGGGLLAGRAGVKGIQAGREATAFKFYEGQGFDSKDIRGHLDGIDFNRPVRVETLSKGTPVSQYQVPGGRQGNYYAPPGTQASELGINPQGVSRTTGAIVDKSPTGYTTTQDVQVLRSTAKPIEDTWSVPGSPYQAQGGGTQYFSADKGAFGVGP